jgi:hypothetical protein
MSPRRIAASAALCGTAVLTALIAARLAGFGVPGIENTAAPVEDGRAYVIASADVVPAPQADSQPNDVPQAVATDGDSLAYAPTNGGGLPDPRPTLPPETPPVQVAALSTPVPAQDQTKEAIISAGPADPCLGVEACIDQYLFALYKRTPKVDTVKVVERTKVTVKKKGKTRTTIKTVTRLVDEDFTWKDPKAAEKAGMPLMQYVIGGMDRTFKLRLYRALRALDDAGLSPGITSAFRDDYRQSLATGLKAAADGSYHGGSRHGGYGHGLAADVVSVKGETRSERLRSSDELWKWIDAHSNEFGIGRPYLDKDPPHLAPIDGKEYAAHRGRINAQLARLETSRRHRSGR